MKVSREWFSWHMYIVQDVFHLMNVSNQFYFLFLAVNEIWFPKFSFTSNLDSWHLVAMEQNLRERPNKCSQCDYASYTASVLKIHLITHTGEKPNKCYQCDFATVQPSNLRTHLKTHSGEKSNKCNQCTMGLSPLKRCIKEFWLNVSFCSHFPAV